MLYVIYLPIDSQMIILHMKIVTKRSYRVFDSYTVQSIYTIILDNWFMSSFVIHLRNKATKEKAKSALRKFKSSATRTDAVLKVETNTTSD